MQPITAVSEPFTIDTLNKAIREMKEQEARQRELAAEHYRKWNALDLDWAAIRENETVYDQTLVVIAESMCILHPRQAATVDRIVNKYRRDGHATTAS
jgi:hypothetical protein